MAEDKRTFRSFLSKYPWHICIMAASLVLAMYQFMFTTNHRIDTIIKMVSVVDEFNDIELGRFGIVYLNRLLGMQWYNPYLTAFLSMATILVTSVVLVYVLWRLIGCEKATPLFVVPVLIFLTPNWTEQLYFSYQSFLVLLGTCLVVLSAVLTLQWVRTLNKRLLVISAAVLLVAFSVYQSFVPLYMTLALAWFLVECVTDKQKDLSYFARTLVGHLIVGGAALVGYFVLDKLASIGAVETDYLSKQILWLSQPLHGVISNIGQSLSSILLARGVVDTWTYTLSVAASLVFLAVFLLKNKTVKMKGFILLAWLCLQLSGVALLLVLGTRTYIRTELAITFVMAFNFLLCWLVAKDTFVADKQRQLHSIWLAAACFAGICGLCINADTTFRLYYTDNVRNDRDQLLAQSVIRDLRSQTTVENGDKAVVFLGEPQLRLDATCLESEVIGVSLFAYHDNCDATNTIIMDCLSINGLDCMRPQEADIKKAWEVVGDMTDYPQEGSILETEDVIVVRLSHDPYAGTDYMESGYEESDLRPDTFVDTHMTQIDGITSDGETVTVQGFSLLLGTDASTLHYDLLLVDITSDRVFRVNTGCAQRLKVAKSFLGDGVKYDACGFIAKFPQELLDGSTFEAVLHCTTDSGESYYIPTDTYLNLSIVTKNPNVK